ncbi:cell division ATP-binding protein FtsE [Candidatus Jorgensenbacteria bacterium RIFCSPLOWO2_02_FULL_45_12]|uniref:Cell division ATP-binding protein FtsE n=2 Tax=Candidatus Joergenseniibacteriota TaxID=1752739 RepID=A0A1F6BMX0_9BACT|nr:MAG: Cell division ATP-binding protein FtsE [Candidatus Jorgensenbacteria bacterium GW2011_GWA2_45_9]OGG38269.1 MAG: cell division ATP-binding protein FtsE [Candidatus Jorgensenbacteria bacterium RIFCSPHIGHO2_02_FULL_45_20]OGG42305.1 MAG: cell division ATP-binding protein FtsE [Candidatus Jorgensenbacteria bacterium RIFCSPLOWO2_02_FULL_45_12]
MIIFQNVTKTYSKGMVALDKVSFKIQPNEFVSFVGRSGAGKSTIIKLLIGEEQPTKGQIFFGSYEVNKLKSNEMPEFRRHIGVIFQDFRLLLKKTAFENVAFALEVEGRAQREINELVPQVLEMVGLKDKAHNFPAELSGGEKQRVAIARAMINRPDVLIADEPTGNLDPFNTWEVIKILTKINELGSTVLLATHDKEIVNALGERVITLEDGRVIKDEANGRFIIG